MVDVISALVYTMGYRKSAFQLNKFNLSEINLNYSHLSSSVSFLVVSTQKKTIHSIHE